MTKTSRAYRQDLKEVLDNLSLDNFRQAVTGVEGLNLDSISSKLCLIRRLEQSSIQFSNAVKVLPITAFIGSSIALQLRNADHTEMRRLYKKFVSRPSTREISDVLFKAYGHGTFTHSIWVRYFPMVRIGGSKVSKNKNQPQWHNTNAKLSPQLLGDKPQAALRKQRDLQLRPWESIQYTSAKLHKRLTIRSRVYYLPAFPNQFGFDSSSFTIIFFTSSNSRSKQHMTSRTSSNSWTIVLGSPRERTGGLFSSGRARSATR